MDRRGLCPRSAGPGAGRARGTRGRLREPRAAAGKGGGHRHRWPSLPVARRAAARRLESRHQQRVPRRTGLRRARARGSARRRPVCPRRSVVKRFLLPAVALILVATACGGDNSSSSGPVTVTLITHNAFAYTTDPNVFDQFTQQTGVKVVIPQGAGDAGLVLNKAILTKGKPEGDVLWGVDNTLLSRAVDSGAFQPYTSPALATVEAPFRDLAPGHELTPVDYGDVCINYDKAWFASKGLAVPQTLDDLRKPEYKNLLVVENPTTSSPGLVFLLATV